MIHKILDFVSIISVTLVLFLGYKLTVLEMENKQLKSELIKKENEIDIKVFEQKQKEKKEELLNENNNKGKDDINLSNGHHVLELKWVH